MPSPQVGLHVVPALLYHIRHQKVERAVKTVGGCVFTAKQKDGKIMIEDGQGGVAHVTIAGVDQSNGVIHVIDKDLLPKS